MKKHLDRLYFSDFKPLWEFATDQARVQAVLVSISYPNPKRYNQLMVANDGNGAYFAVYGSGGHGTAGKPTHDSETPFDRLYSRPDLPAEYL